MTTLKHLENIYTGQYNKLLKKIITFNTIKNMKQNG